MTLSECIKNWKQSNYSIARPSCLKQCSKLSLETDQLFHLTQSTFWIQQKFRKKYKTITGEKYYSAKNLTLLTITRKVESKWIRRMFGTARSFKASLPLDIPEWHALRKYFLVRAYHINRVLLCIRMWIKFSVSHFAVIATKNDCRPDRSFSRLWSALRWVSLDDVQRCDCGYLLSSSLACVPSILFWGFH